jgi:hypothetical protein
LIQADVDGLSALATHCHTQAAAVAGSAMPPAGSCQTSSTAAVADAHADVAAAAARFTQRMQSNAAKFRSSATGFAETEMDSATAVEQVV